MDVEYCSPPDKMVAKSNMIRRHHRRRSSVTRETTVEKMVQLPLLRDVPIGDHQQLFRLKLQMCQVRFNFDDMNSNQMGKDLKRNTLSELIDYVNTDRGQKIFTAPGVMEDVIAMVSVNIFRALPPQIDGFDPEEDEPVLEPSWPHLQVVYEFLLRFVVSKEVLAKTAKRKGVIDQVFCLKLVQIFDSEDPRERDYLKTILHRVYGKFMSHRAFIRKQISYTFQRFAFETHRHNGISELLEILGSIINGFALPLKPEHMRFLITSLVPLHNAPTVATYHQQLSYCIVQFIEKHPATAVPIIKGLTKYWPWSQSSKQVMFLNELEDILEAVVPEYTEQVLPYALKIVARSIASEHFQVVERTLYLWNNEQLAVHLFGRQQAHLVLPKIIDCLREKEQHWNPTVKNLAEEVIRLNKTRVNGQLWTQLEQNTDQRQQEEANLKTKRESMWEEIKSKQVAAMDSSNHPYLVMRTFNVQPPQVPFSSSSSSSSSSNASTSQQQQQQQHQANIQENLRELTMSD